MVLGTVFRVEGSGQRTPKADVCKQLSGAHGRMPIEIKSHCVRAGNTEGVLVINILAIKNVL